MSDATKFITDPPILQHMERVGETVSPDFKLTDHQFRALRIPPIIDAVGPTTDQVIAGQARRLLAEATFTYPDRFTPTMAAKLVQLA